jgi:hypothetical protein
VQAMPEFEGEIEMGIGSYLKLCRVLNSLSLKYGFFFLT